MDVVTVKHEVEIRKTLAMLEEFIEMNHKNKNSQQVQNLAHDIFGRTAIFHGIGFEIGDTASPTYHDAIDQMRKEVFNRFGEKKDILNEYIATLFQWPPQFRNIALAVNIARAMFASGINVQFSLVRPVELRDGTQMKNGWKAFYHTFGTIIYDA